MGAGREAIGPVATLAQPGVAELILFPQVPHGPQTSVPGQAEGAGLRGLEVLPGLHWLRLPAPW